MIGTLKFSHTTPEGELRNHTEVELRGQFKTTSGTYFSHTYCTKVTFARSKKSPDLRGSGRSSIELERVRPQDNEHEFQRKTV
jgi:hypothetical protein